MTLNCNACYLQTVSFVDIKPVFSISQWANASLSLNWPKCCCKNVFIFLINGWTGCKVHVSLCFTFFSSSFRERRLVLCLLVTLPVKVSFSEARIFGVVYFYFSKHLIEMQCGVLSHWSCWVIPVISFYTQSFHCALVCVSEKCLRACMHLWLSFCVDMVLLWSCDRKRGGIWVLTSYFVLGLSSFVDRRGFARASLTAKKQAVPSPATTSTEVHRNLRVSCLYFPLLLIRSWSSPNSVGPVKHFTFVLRARKWGKEEDSKRVRDGERERAGKLRIEWARKRERRGGKDYSGKVREFKTGRGEMSYYTLQPVLPFQ